MSIPILALPQLQIQMEVFDCCPVVLHNSGRDIIILTPNFAKTSHFLCSVRQSTTCVYFYKCIFSFPLQMVWFLDLWLSLANFTAFAFPENHYYLCLDDAETVFLSLANGSLVQSAHGWYNHVQSIPGARASSSKPKK